MSELTDWERHRLADLERQLAEQDPKLAALLTHPVRAHRTGVTGRMGWVLGCVGIVLFLSGSTLRDGSVLALGLALLAVCWVPSWRARTKGFGDSSPWRRFLA